MALKITIFWWKLIFQTPKFLAGTTLMYRRVSTSLVYCGTLKFDMAYYGTFIGSHKYLLYWYINITMTIINIAINITGVVGLYQQYNNYLVFGHVLFFPIVGMNHPNLTNSYFSEG